ncbi:MAG: DNA helicase II [Gammaproteobacteria bacterium]|nr:DNA helicase II [Gammaproteobacteria bacterium]
MDVSEIFESLNEPQRQAVTSDSNNLLVLAGAGSGKTRVIAHRVAWLIKAGGINPHSILTVTFTNKAAREMRGRIEGIVEQEMGNFWCGTFHGISHRLLRAHWEEAGLRREFAILDSEDQYRVIKRVSKSLGLDDTKWPPRQIQWFINKQKDECRRSKDVETADDYFAEKVNEVYAAYEELCERESLVDFGELLLRTYLLLKTNENVLDHYKKRFRHILVDEFQDTNEVQYQFLKLLCEGEGHIMSVGDDDQSIYGWRGAKSENINRFTKDYKNTEIIRLEQNYRSTSIILGAANAVIENNQGRMGKELWTEQKEGEPISIYSAYNEDDEARYVVGSIQNWMEQGRDLNEVAILYRSNAQSRALEEAILREGLSYRIYGGLRFYERAEIKNAMSYLRLVFGREDDAAFERVINIPPRGIGAKTLDIIRSRAQKIETSLWKACQDLLETDGLTPRASQSVEGFLSDFEDLEIETKDLPLRDLVDHVIQRSGLIEYHKKEAGEKGRTRVENLAELVTAASDFEPEPLDDAEEIPLKLFIDHAALDAGETQASDHESAIQLMTLHSAKGLEFPLVFITGFEEGLFPHKLSIEEADQLQEERRLCYVGMTRSMERLFIVHAEMRNLHGTETFNPPSRFLREIPEELTLEVRTGGSIPRRNTLSGKVSKGEVPDTEFKLGQRVFHEVFGEGVILNYEGQGSNARVEVNFDSSKTKWLMVSYAKLQNI